MSGETDLEEPPFYAALCLRLPHHRDAGSTLAEPRYEGYRRVAFRLGEEVRFAPYCPSRWQRFQCRLRGQPTTLHIAAIAVCDAPSGGQLLWWYLADRIDTLFLLNGGGVVVPGPAL